MGIIGEGYSNAKELLQCRCVGLRAGVCGSYDERKTKRKLASQAKPKIRIQDD